MATLASKFYSHTEKKLMFHNWKEPKWQDDFVEKDQPIAREVHEHHDLFDVQMFPESTTSPLDCDAELTHT